MVYEVKLDVFEGPIDLLLHLITRQRVDIYDVSIARVTEDYLAALAAMDDVDLETATAFLVVAASLLELKSLRLLPARAGAEADGALLEERDRLLARLVECATYREAGRWIAAALERGAAFHGRAAPPEERYVDLVPDLAAAVDPGALAAAASRLLAPKPRVELDTSHVAPITASVRSAIVDVAGRLRRDGAASFEALCGGVEERVEVVVRFLALLELFKAGAVGLTQDGRFGDIRTWWTSEVSLDEVLEDVDDYAEVG